MTLRTVFSATLALALTASAFGQKERLKVGDPAPGLDVKVWIDPNGQPTTKGVTIESGNVYVVEFWATWCVPCRKSMPHLSKLQKEYADQGLTIIGVSDEKENLVKSFAKSNTSKIDYILAVDNAQRTKRTWMSAAGQNAIPCAFIVDRNGKIAYIGHPMDDEFESVIEKVLAGRYDPKLVRKAEPVLNAARSARQMRNWSLASRHYDEVVALDAAVFANVALEKFDMLLLDMNDRQAAYTYARQELLNKSFASDAGALRMLAEKVASDPKIEQAGRDMDFALEVAEAARRVAGDQDAQSLATLAMVRYHRGELAHAVDLQKQAYFVAPPKRKPEYRHTLTAYQEAAARGAAVGSRNP